MSCLYKDGNGNITLVAGTLTQEVMNEIKKYIDNENEISPLETFAHSGQPAPYDGIATFTCSVMSVGEVGFYVNGTKFIVIGSSLSYSAPYVITYTFMIRKGDIIRTYGTNATIETVQYYKKRDYSRR